MKEFEKAEIEVVRFDEENVVATSGGCQGKGTGTNCSSIGCTDVGCHIVGCTPDD